MADQNSELFLKRGRQIDDQVRPLSERELAKYQKAMSTAQEIGCTDPANDKTLPWDKIGDLHLLEVCLFHFARNIADRNLLKKTLEDLGFKSVLLIPYSEHVTKRMGIEGDGYLISANVSDSYAPSGLFDRIDSYFYHGLSFGIFIDSNGMPFSAKITPTRI